MMNKIRIARTIVSDFAGLTRVCGPRVAVKWLFMIAKTSKQCAIRGDLLPADRAMGQGPYLARLGTARARLSSPQVISGIREIWARDVYLGEGFLSIPPNALVVDLGANVGNFTMLALGHGPGVSAIAVEANRPFNETLLQTAASNGWADRVRVVNGFIGGETEIQVDARSTPGYGQTPWISEQDLLALVRPKRVDFLKCDIEGSEFGLLKPDSELLALTDRLAIEVHDFAGRRESFLEMLQSSEFEVCLRRSDPDCCIVLARRRNLATSPPDH